MKRQTGLLLVTVIFWIQSNAQLHPDYENPAVFERNQTLPHATLMSYENIEQALSGNRKASPYHFSLNGTWQLSGSVALVNRLLAGKTRKASHIPRAEVIAEALALARDFMGPLLTVMDATAWGIHRQDGKPHAMVRNVLLAGDDPVAVDAVAAKLAGVDPRKMSWLQLCQDRGLGMASLDKIVIKGRKDLLSPDFLMPKGTFGTGRRAGSIWAWPGRILGALGRKKMDTTFGNSAWGRLLVDYEQEK